MKKVPYLIESHVFTPNGPLMEFNGIWKPEMSSLDAIRFSLDNPLHGIVRTGGKDDMPYQYFLQGKEYDANELFED